MNTDHDQERQDRRNTGMAAWLHNIRKRHDGDRLDLAGLLDLANLTRKEKNK